MDESIFLLLLNFGFHDDGMTHHLAVEQSNGLVHLIDDKGHTTNWAYAGLLTKWELFLHDTSAWSKEIPWCDSAGPCRVQIQLGCPGLAVLSSFG